MGVKLVCSPTEITRITCLSLALLIALVGVPAAAARNSMVCGGVAATITGTSGPDRIIGTSGPDVIAAGGGSDWIDAGDGDDIICGGRGADQVFGGLGDDHMRGGAGMDRCDGGTGIDTAEGCEEPRATEHGDRPPPAIRPGSGMVALTFDDGPSPQWTPQVLDILADYGIHATFFVIGERAAKHPELVARMLAEGHSVQNHTHSHPYLTELSDAAVTTEIALGRDEITAAGGVAPRCVRPPHGRVTPRIRQLAAAEHQEVVMWDVDPTDWRFESARVIAHVLANADGGEVVLLHDGRGGTSTRSLRAIIDGLQERGLGFATICS